ncbi:MAG: M48 family metallopeptidase [Sedimentisphaerales bacterium]|nr:M48 family metallopeptidase [Sedimentisphaerales bacterium]
MGGLFYHLGKKLGPKVRRGQWMWKSAVGTEAEMIAAEEAVGVDLAAEVCAQVQMDQTEEIRHQVRQIGAVLTGKVANKKRKFRFEVIRGNQPNAFALPGGRIFVTRSLLELCEWDTDEIAYVLAHEMAHVIKGHAMERIMTSSALQAASRMTPMRGALSGWIKRVGIQFLSGAYSRDVESEADRLATLLTLAAGFDPSGGERLFLHLARRSQDPSGLGQYFASHPPFAERIVRIRQILREKKRKQK